MALNINTNIGALGAAAAASSVNKSMETAMERLSTGLRINTAADDAAGVAIASRMDAQIRGLNQAIRNAADGQSLIDTTEGAHQEVTNILQRMRELAVQSANDTNVAGDRSNMQAEVTQLLAEIDRISAQTTWNGVAVLDGSFTSKSLQIGAERGQTVAVNVDSVSTSSIGSHQVDSNLNLASGTANGMSATGDVVITGKLGSATIDVSATGKTAKAFAAAVNSNTSSTGVTANAVTKAKLSNFSAPDTVSFTINGTSIGAVAIADATDLRDLKDAINAIAGSTGVTASLSGGSNAALELTDADGDDIIFGSYATTSTALMRLSVLDKNGNVAQSTGGTDLIAEFADLAAHADGATYPNAVAFTVTGQVSMNSDEAFTLATTHDAVDFDTDTPADDALETVLADGEFFGAAGTAGTVISNSSLTNVGTVNISTATGAGNALDVIDAAIEKINSARADLGAISNRLDNTISNLTNISTNISSSQARIQDADFAAESTNLAKAQILQQAATAMLAQANASKQGVLQLLQG
ncbi:flagellar filament protein [Rhodobacterales bacterium LSUCC0031]|nr:flagellar filament protein [Rhodobacterales bacterium LSUCC0031]